MGLVDELYSEYGAFDAFSKFKLLESYDGLYEAHGSAFIVLFSDAGDTFPPNGVSDV